MPMAIRSLRPISKATMQDRVYQQLKQALMSGAFAPGQTVTLRGVANDLGTSAMPIRDAIRRLVSDQALEMPSLRSIRVPLMSLDRYESVLRIRKLLEGEAAAMAATRVARADVDALAAINALAAEALEADDIGRMLLANRDFHFALYRLGGDNLLLSLIEKAWLLSGPYLNLLSRSGGVAGGEPLTLRDHDVLLKALRAGDAERARAAIVMDIEGAADLYRSRIRTLGDPNRRARPPATRRTGRK